jgi:serine/threonine protein phosphatase PrpC
MVRTRLTTASGSHTGLVRHNNEDRVYCDPERGIFLVVDGMGGQNAGEQAAQIAEARIRRRMERMTGTAEERVREAITVANNEIYEMAQRRPEWAGMACVLTLALVEDGHATVGHVGDSRLYKIHAGAIKKVTRDHSPIGEREDSGELNEKEAMRHPRRNEVFRDVGSEPHSPEDPDFIETWRVPVEPDCALLLCSDGLSDQVPANEIRKIVERNAEDPSRAVEELIEAANLAGGKDNVSIVILQGEKFAPPARPAERRTGRILLSRPACFLYGALLALLAGQLWIKRFSPPPAIPTPQGPRTHTVGSGATYATITDALNHALPGDTVEVLGGEYRETVRLKEGVTVRSRAPREAILRAPATAGVPGFAVWSEGVRSGRIAGFRILADGQMPLAAGVAVVDSSVEVDDLEITGVHNGVEIRGASSPAVRASSIHDNTGAGIFVVAPAAPWLAHNMLAGNGRGIVAGAGSRPTLVGNYFGRNSLEAFSLPPEISQETVLKFNVVPRETQRRPTRGRR